MAVPARAARLIQHNRSLEVEEVSLPEPSSGEVVVTMAYAAVNPVDGYAVAGRVAPDAPLPRTLGSEGAGQVGDRRVMVRGWGLGTRRDGLWASAAVVPEQALIDVPEGVSLQQAAAMGVAGVTAWRCVTEKAKVTAEDRVLVLGASGGVGSIVVSAAHRLGATVWGQTGHEDKMAFIRARGADEVTVASDAGSLAEATRAFRPTVVFDPLGAGFFAAAVEVLAERGRLVLFGTSASASAEVPLQAIYRKALTVYGYGGLIESDEDLARAARQALAALRDGRLDIVIDRALPLDQVNEALDQLAQRTVLGKLVLDLRS